MLFASKQQNAFEFERSYVSSKIILNHMIDNYPDSISQMRILFYRKTIQLQRDQDLLQKLLLCKDRHVSRQVLDFLFEADGNVLDYVQAISGFIKESAMSEYYYELKDLAAFVARIFHQGKDDLPTRRTCLDLWDDIFWDKPMAIKPLSDLMDQVEMRLLCPFYRRDNLIEQSLMAECIAVTRGYKSTWLIVTSAASLTV